MFKSLTVAPLLISENKPELEADSMTIPEIVALFPSKVPANPSMGVQVLPDKSNVPFVASVTVFPEKNLGPARSAHSQSPPARPGRQRWRG